ncbi:MAG: hypothetical protein AB7K68_05480 [Bacteriovoracia bacterium]
MKILLAALLSLTFSHPAFSAIYSASYKDNGVSIEKRVIDTYRAALEARGNNDIKQTIAQLKADLAGFGTVGIPNKDNLFLLSRGESAPSDHDTSTRVRSGKYLLAIPTTIRGSGNVTENGALLAAYFNVQVGKTVEISLENFVELVDRPDSDTTEIPPR